MLFFKDSEEARFIDLFDAAGATDLLPQFGQVGGGEGRRRETVLADDFPVLRLFQVDFAEESPGSLFLEPGQAVLPEPGAIGTEIGPSSRL